MACCIAPTLSHILQHYTGHGDIIENCAWVRDRHYLALKYGVADPYREPICFTSKALVLFQCGCSHCLLYQELNHIKVRCALRCGLLSFLRSLTYSLRRLLRWGLCRGQVAGP